MKFEEYFVVLLNAKRKDQLEQLEFIHCSGIAFGMLCNVPKNGKNKHGGD